MLRWGKRWVARRGEESELSGPRVSSGPHSWLYSIQPLTPLVTSRVDSRRVEGAQQRQTCRHRAASASNCGDAMKTANPANQSRAGSSSFLSSPRITVCQYGEPRRLGCIACRPNSRSISRAAAPSRMPCSRPPSKRSDAMRTPRRRRQRLAALHSVAQLPRTGPSSRSPPCDASGTTLSRPFSSRSVRSHFSLSLERRDMDRLAPHEYFDTQKLPLHKLSLDHFSKEVLPRRGHHFVRLMGEWDSDHLESASARPFIAALVRALPQLPNLKQLHTPILVRIVQDRRQRDSRQAEEKQALRRLVQSAEAITHPEVAPKDLFASFARVTGQSPAARVLQPRPSLRPGRPRFNPAGSTSPASNRSRYISTSLASEVRSTGSLSPIRQLH